MSVKGNADSGRTESASEKQNTRTNSNCAAALVQCERIAEQDERCGKACAMFAYNIGAANFKATQAKFSQHPEWRSA